MGEPSSPDPFKRHHVTFADPFILAAVAFAFLLGGFVKGAAGLGMPAITVALLVFVLDLPTAMGLMLLPGLTANLYQAFAGPDWYGMLKRIAPFLLPSLLTIWFGTGLLITIDNSWLTGTLGVLLLAYSALNLSGITVTIPQNRERWVGPLFGAMNGVFTGLTGVTSTPSVIYMNGLRLPREHFVQAMGLLFLISYVVLTACMFLRGIVTPAIGAGSAYAMVFGLAGLALGTRLRKRLPEKQFKYLFYAVLCFLGINLIVGSLT